MSVPRLASVPPPASEMHRRLASTENAVADALVEMQEREVRLLSQIDDLKKENAQLRRDHEAGLARAWRQWGWQTTIIIATAALNILAANVWRLDNRGRSSSYSRVGAGPSSTGSRRGAVPAPPVSGAGATQP